MLSSHPLMLHPACFYQFVYFYLSSVFSEMPIFFSFLPMLELIGYNNCILCLGKVVALVACLQIMNFVISVNSVISTLVSAALTAFTCHYILCSFCKFITGEVPLPTSDAASVTILFKL